MRGPKSSLDPSRVAHHGHGIDTRGSSDTASRAGSGDWGARLSGDKRGAACDNRGACRTVT